MIHKNSIDNILNYAEQANKSFGIAKAVNTIQSTISRTIDGEIQGFQSKNLYGEKMWTTIESVRNSRPLVQCITNYASMDVVANALLAVGASPAMIHAPEEVPEVVGTLKDVNGALYVNIGTLSDEWIRSFKIAVSSAGEKNVPWVLDPLAVGFTELRTKTVKELLEIHPPSAIKGNQTEIITIAKARGFVPKNQKNGNNNKNKNNKNGSQFHEDDDEDEDEDEDSNNSRRNSKEPSEALLASKYLALSLGCVVCVTGDVKQVQNSETVFQVSTGCYVTDGDTVLQVQHGVEMFSRIAAGRSIVSALICAFIAARPPNVSILEASAAGIAFVGIVSQEAMKESRGPGSFRVNLMDCLYNCSKLNYEMGIRISKIE